MGGETVIPEVHALGNDEIKLLFRRLRVAEFLTGELFPQAEAASASAEAALFLFHRCSPGREPGPYSILYSMAAPTTPASLPREALSRRGGLDLSKQPASTSPRRGSSSRSSSALLMPPPRQMISG